MPNSKKLLQAAAGAAAGGAGLNVEEVFSTYLYAGNSSTQTITNGIDLSGEGGLVWTKLRSGADGHAIQDTERGANKILSSNNTNAEATESWGYSFNSNGFSLNTSSGQVNASGSDYASWTFRKAPKFFTCLTWTGDGTGTRTISHDLNTSNIGSIIIKKTSGVEDWYVMHRSATNGLTSYGLLNQTSGFFSTGSGISNVTSTTFDISSYYNGSGAEWVAYLFAHNDGDGDFGPTGDQDIIKCGSFTTDSSGNASVDLGWEPQWLICKRSDGVSNWLILDTMRGWSNTSINRLYADVSNADSFYNAGFPHSPTATGFQFTSGLLSNSANYIYIAIRRGPMAVPESATDVFHIDDQSTSISEAPRYRSGFVTDFYFWKEKHTSTDWTASTRLLGTNILKPNLTNAETSSSLYTWDFMNGALNLSSVDANKPAWMWKRAPSFFDVVAYTGNGVAGRTVSHNLGVAPNMMWVKRRSNIEGWQVYISDLGATKHLELNRDFAVTSSSNRWNSTEPTATEFTVSNIAHVNASGDTYVAYLFASLDGISRVGSYTGNGNATQNIDCGFSSGSRFLFIKSTSSGDWRIWDVYRGITANNDPYLRFNNNSAEITNQDLIEPLAAGFVVNPDLNVNGEKYIFYAIAN